MMKRFKSKLTGEEVNADVWNGGEDLRGSAALIDWLVEQGTRGGIKYQEGDGQDLLVIHQGEEKLEAQPNWWVLQEVETGKWDTMSTEAFKELYEAVV